MAKRQATPRQAIDLLKRHAFLREQFTLQAIDRRMIQARARARTFWMPQARSANAPPRPDKLSRRSGALAGTIQVSRTRRIGEDLVFGLTAGSARVRYQGHEFGMTINHPGSVARPGHLLSWIDKATGERRFAKRTRPHLIRIPPRPYMRPAVAEQIRGLVADLRSGYRKIRQDVFGE